MKKIIIFIVFLLNSSFCYNQNTTIQETIDYINSITPTYLYHDWWSSPISWFKSERCYGNYYHYLKLEENGYISVMRHITFSNCTDNIDNGKVIDYEYRKFHNSEVYIPYIKVSENNEITIRGKTNNKAFGDDYNDYSLEFCEFTDTYDCKRCLNALKYLFTTLQNDKKYGRNSQNDPFAPQNPTNQKNTGQVSQSVGKNQSSVSSAKSFYSNKYGYTINIPTGFKETSASGKNIDFKLINNDGSSILVNVSPRSEYSGQCVQ